MGQVKGTAQAVGDGVTQPQSRLAESHTRHCGGDVHLSTAVPIPLIGALQAL